MEGEWRRNFSVIRSGGGGFVEGENYWVKKMEGFQKHKNRITKTRRKKEGKERETFVRLAIRCFWFLVWFFIVSFCVWLMKRGTHELRHTYMIRSMLVYSIQ